MPKILVGEAYEAFVRRHWGRHKPKVEPIAPSAAEFRALAQFANISSAVVVVLSQRPAERDLFIAGCGLIGETGEIVELLKKRVRDGVLDREKLLLELGDALFYLTRLAQFEDGPAELIAMAHAAFFNLLRELGFALAEVSRANVVKLEARYGAS